MRICKTFKPLNISKPKKLVNGFMIEGKAIVFVKGSSNGKNRRRQVMPTNTNNRSALNK